MNAPANCRLIGRWRIVEADLWDRAHLDLCGPARLTITELSLRETPATGSWRIPAVPSRAGSLPSVTTRSFPWP